MTANDSDVVLVYYDHPNIGQHKVVGYVTHTNYGYRGGGDKFYVHRQDIAAQPNIFKVIEETVAMPMVEVKPVPPPVSSIPIPEPTVTEPPSPPENIPNIMDTEEIMLDVVPGVTPAIRAQLNAAGVHSVQELLDFGEEGLMTLKGIGKTRATSIYAFAQAYVEKHA